MSIHDAPIYRSRAKAALDIAKMPFPRASCVGAIAAVAFMLSAAEPVIADSKNCSTDSASMNAGMPAWFHPLPETEILQRLAKSDTARLRHHAMTVWAALTDIDYSKSPNVLFFEAWPTKQETFSADSILVDASPFTAPAQLSRNKTTSLRMESAAGSDGKVFTIVRYNCIMYRHIRDNGFHRAAVMQKLNAANQNRPIADREVPPFPKSSIMIKAAFQVVSHRRPTYLAYWDGPHRSSSPDAPGPTTWLDKMVIVPPGSTQAPDGTPAVNLERFYRTPLRAADVARLKVELGVDWLEEGDFAILVGMHVATREITNWTWQTFWWSFQKPRPALGMPRQVRPPFDNYELEIGYDFMTPAGNLSGLPNRAFNPYLEAEFGEDAFSRPGQRGIESNCMSCHRAAAWPGRTAGFVANGLIKNNDPLFFTGNTKTDYVWGIPENVPEP